MLYTDTQCVELAQAAKRGEALLEKGEPPTFKAILAAKESPAGRAAAAARQAARDKINAGIVKEAVSLYKELRESTRTWELETLAKIKTLTESGERGKAGELSARFMEVQWESRQRWASISDVFKQGQGAGANFQASDIAAMKILKKLIGKKLYAGRIKT